MDPPAFNDENTADLKLRYVHKEIGERFLLLHTNFLRDRIPSLRDLFEDALAAGAGPGHPVTMDLRPNPVLTHEQFSGLSHLLELLYRHATAATAAEAVADTQVLGQPMLDDVHDAATVLGLDPMSLGLDFDEPFYEIDSETLVQTEMVDEDEAEDKDEGEGDAEAAAEGDVEETAQEWIDKFTAANPASDPPAYSAKE
ncbi:hypothetical protein BDK51DRAFT_29207 [Blyttiomyces helicus]|uniref:Uncharacterized protein n=1 Tax=Blyttiomyces helicus TaxID=388810 RepID=A0A4V1ISN1_9FUNG|nr:hypothetical protein BDK51DRAFT_29207 [Blyttiomyces helicus]|eukprot:RKO94137.1 hypothetical protein BDK51DRAFT_29207 [Blyttiomyces helicus]